MKPRVLVTRMLPGTALDRIRAQCALDLWPEPTPPDRPTLEEKMAGVDGVLTMLTDRVDESLLDRAGANLKVVSNYAVGFDNIDIPACTRRGIAVGNTPGVLTETTADLAFSLLMSAARRIVEGDRLCRRGGFRAWSPTMLLGWDVHLATLGILGMGRIGRAVARRARGFDMEVLFTGGTRTTDDVIDGARRVSFDELAARADFLSIHIPLNETTRGLIDAAVFKRMKPTAVLINTARGAVIQQAALVEALREGEIAAAALDVTEPEPLPRDHPLQGQDNCIIVPHLGSGSLATRSRMASMAADNLLAGLRNEPLPHCVNPESYGNSRREPGNR